MQRKYSVNTKERGDETDCESEVNRTPVQGHTELSVINRLSVGGLSDLGCMYQTVGKIPCCLLRVTTKRIWNESCQDYTR